MPNLFTLAPIGHAGMLGIVTASYRPLDEIDEVGLRTSRDRGGRRGEEEGRVGLRGEEEGGYDQDVK